jgi:alpha-methylacyl-CoA racemase
LHHFLSWLLQTQHAAACVALLENNDHPRENDRAPLHEVMQFDPSPHSDREGTPMGPLNGLKILEIAGIGPCPFAAMMLADMGADVLRIDRPPQAEIPRRVPPERDTLRRGRRSVIVDLKNPEGIILILRLVEHADALIEGFRPGVMERLGLGPDVCLQRNPRLVYGRATGWGQDGPPATAAGHDINYIALSGTLHAIGRAGQPPTPPVNLLGDFGGGGMLLAFGVLSALLERASSGEGQVIDAAMVDGAALLATAMHGYRSIGYWNDDRGTNLLDSGAHFYDVYECADGAYVAVGSIESQFYAQLLALIGLGAEELPEQLDRDQWPALKKRLAEIFKTKTREEWCRIMEGSDACFAPVLSMGDAPDHAHNKHRQTFVEIAGDVQPAPAPRFSRTPPTIPSPPPLPGQHTDEALAAWDISAQEVTTLRACSAIV